MKSPEKDKPSLGMYQCFIWGEVWGKDTKWFLDKDDDIGGGEGEDEVSEEQKPDDGSDNAEESKE